MKKLVGEGKPFHSAVDKSAKGLKRKVGTGAEFMKELMGITGIKPTEINERGLNEIMGMPRMTHDQFMANLAIRPAPAVGEKVLGGKRSIGNVATGTAPYHGTYTLPGGENYREMLIKLPDEHSNMDQKLFELDAQLRRAAPENRSAIMRQMDELRDKYEKTPEVFEGVGSHFGGEPGILASMRVKDRLVPDLEGPHNVTIIGDGGASNKKFNTREEAEKFADVKHQGGYKTKLTPLNNKKYLHLEELQSDWHQQGREKGYQYGLMPEDLKELTELYKKYNEEDGLLQDDWKRVDELEAKKKSNKFIPDAPFKKNWEEMALKRLIHHAAEKGYHGVVVTPGAEQADRYDISKHINHVIYDEMGNLRAIDKNGRTVIAEPVEPEKLHEHVGKELSEKILSNREKRLQAKDVYRTALKSDAPNEVVDPLYKEYLSHPIEYSGLDLRTGDEAMKGFYDKKVPNILNSIGKKYGVKTQLGGFKLLGDPSQRGDAAERLGLAHVPLANMTTPQAQAFNAKLDEANAKQLHHFPITEDMRKDILTNGLPLYKQGGKVHMAKGDDMDHMRLALMNKKNGGSSKTTKGYVVHEPLKPHPEVGKRFTATPQGNLAPMQAFDLMKQEGKGSIVPIPYDATTRDMLVTNVSGHNLTNPLLTEAGFDYSLDPVNMAQNIGGASSYGISRRVQDRINQAAKEHGENVFLAPNIMGEDAENFSHHPAHIVLDLMAQRQLKKNTLRALSDDLRGQVEIKRNAKTGVTTKTYPFKNFLGYDHPNMMEQVMKGGHGLETSAGNLRKKMMERLSLVNMQKLLDYNMGDLKAAILDPELATDPKAYMGRTFVKAQPGAALRPSTHTSYDTDYAGTNVGGLGANRPLEILMPDVYEDINAELTARPAKVKKTPAQMRAQVVGALEKRKAKFAQPINARVINNAGLYEEGLRQGEFDPKNVDSVLAYFKRKGGYAEGGMVDIKNIGVEEAPNMDVKAFIPPRPATATKLPVGGIFQQTPQQPMQGMPQQQDQQPQGAPFQPQGAPAQPPSNILQMTPQGQAMSAMRPPQMARGGKVDRDMMMLHVMNRKMKVKHG